MIELTKEQYDEYEKIADEIWQGKRGKDYNGKKRKEALGEAYEAVQSIINNKYYKLKNNIKIVDNKTESNDIDWDSIKINKANTNNSTNNNQNINTNNSTVNNNKPAGNDFDWDSIKYNNLKQNSNTSNSNAESDELIKVGEANAHVKFQNKAPNEFKMTGSDSRGYTGTFPIYKQPRPRRDNIKLKTNNNK